MFKRYFLAPIIAVTAWILALLFFLTQPISFASPQKYSVSVSVERLQKHVAVLVNTPLPRNHINIDSLNASAAYISSEFESLSCDLQIQEFNVQEGVYKNVSCIFKPQRNNKSLSNRKTGRIIIGAHYDVYHEYPGADDNAT